MKKYEVTAKFQMEADDVLHAHRKLGKFLMNIGNAKPVNTFEMIIKNEDGFVNMKEIDDEELDIPQRNSKDHDDV